MTRDIAERPVHGELVKADTMWFHVFRSMVDSGDLARMKGSSLKVYLIIKAHVNLHTGVGGPGIETISAKADLSIAQVKRAVAELESLGYIAKSRRGRANEYRVRETIQIRDQSGKPTGVASWEYVPAAVRDTVSDLNSVLDSQDIRSARIVQIERLQVNINQVGPGSVVVNVQDALAQISPGLREKLSDLLQRAGVVEAGSYTQRMDDTDHQ
ncbi:helix-turn-helix domain-containing protein [Burkholderia pseudomallei]|uniref:helix-turn-helix domain-containing protein n=1 Tax=Burkholderia pseudomallei TaxID=28450 RepID=UPI000811AD7C|nr:helix-turn-helix domain-containing protein [Burkholderia pseudomallei]ANW51318.1 hypothetical protein A7U58_15260 [Burkholderia pseudomallei]ANW57312.1 hypothetical protein A7U59_15235 [Burkholderia pseudomallei]MCS6598339.1 helix-turn-helix domain-containing protein [Burkholderia pseudomallei]